MAATNDLPAAQDGDQEQPRKRSRFKVIMVVGSILLVLGALAGTTYWWLFLRPGAPGLDGLLGSETAVVEGSATAAQGNTATTNTGGSGSAKTAADTASSGSTGSATNTKKQNGGTTGANAVPRPVPLPELLVNLADPAGDTYLRIRMEVEVSAPEAAQELTNNTARIRDAIILLLSGKTAAELASAEGKLMLKNEVASRLNQILGAPRVTRIFFTDFVIQ